MSNQASNLMATYLGLVRALAWKIHQKLPRNVELDDLIGYGAIGLAEAATTYDPSRGLKFTTFAFHRIRGAILDGLSTMSWFRIEKYYQDAYRSEEPSSDEESASMEPPREWFRQTADRLDAQRVIALQAAAQAIDKGPTGEGEASQREVANRIRQLVDALPAAAAELLRATYYEGLTLKDAAARMGRNKSWASRLHARALYKLGQALKREGLA